MSGVMVEFALDLAGLGYYVFPIAERGKVPLTGRGFKDATRDERKILHMWDRTPGANIGIDLGRSGVFVVDMDPKYGADPEEAIDALGLNRDDLVSVRTGEAPEPTDELPHSLAGTRGMHLYFAGVYPTRATPVAGVEIRGVGGYTVAPGSAHASGVPYVGVLPKVEGLPTPPPSIVTLLRTAERSKVVAPRVDGPIPSGMRNGTLASFAGSMRRRGMSEGAILSALVIENARCDPPLDDGELRTIARSIARYAPAGGLNGDSEVPNGTAPAAEPAEPGDHPLLMDLQAAMRLAMQPVPWLVDGIASAGAVTTLAGIRGEAKTWLGLFMCNGVAHGTDVAGIACRKAPALYVDAENGPRTMGRRFLDIGLEPDAFKVADGGRLQLPRDAKILRQLIDATGAQLCVLDSLRRLSPGAREDKSDDMAPIFAALSIIARETDCAIVVLHHRSVKFGAPDTRGSSAIEDQSDLIYVLERDQRDPQRKRRKRLRCTKSRIDVEPEDRWVRLDRLAGFITMGEAEPFEPKDDDDDDAPARNAMADQIRALAERVRKDGAWPPGRLAEGVGVEPQDSTFKRALRELCESGEWTAEGQTRARVYRPNDLGHGGLNADLNPPPDPLWPEDKPKDIGQGLDPNWRPYDTGPEPDDDEDDD
jgi:hypothetical protein